MPEFTVKEVRLPELHLPEINREEIVRTLSGVRIPEVDLAAVRRARIKVPMVTLTSSEVGRLIAAGAAVARFVRPAPSRGRLLANPFGRRSRSPIARIVRPKPKRSRRPLAIGAIVVVAVAIWAVLRRPATRRRLELASQDARERLATWRAEEGPADATGTATGSVTVADTPVDAQGFANSTDDAGSPSTAGLTDDLASHATETDGTPAFEESQTTG